MGVSSMPDTNIRFKAKALCMIGLCLLGASGAIISLFSNVSALAMIVSGFIAVVVGVAGLLLILLSRKEPTIVDSIITGFIGVAFLSYSFLMIMRLILF